MPHLRCNFLEIFFLNNEHFACLTTYYSGLKVNGVDVSLLKGIYNEFLLEEGKLYIVGLLGKASIYERSFKIQKTCF